MKFMILVLVWIAVAATVSGCVHDDVQMISYDPDFVDLVEADRVHRIKVYTEPSGVVHITGWTKPDSVPGTPFRVEVLKPLESIREFLQQNRMSYGVGVVQATSTPDDWSSLIVRPIVLGGIGLAFVIGMAIFAMMLGLRLVRALERIASNTENAKGNT